MSTESENFMGHLLHSHDLVRGWPDWKKNIWPDNDRLGNEEQAKQIEKKNHLASSFIVSREMPKRR